jgi:hypothetical protein
MLDMLISMSCHLTLGKKREESFSDGKTLKGGSSLKFFLCCLFLYTFMAVKRRINTRNMRIFDGILEMLAWR